MMNRRDAALLAHLDAMETRITIRFDNIDQAIQQLREDIAVVKLELATHHHGGDES